MMNNYFSENIRNFSQKITLYCDLEIEEKIYKSIKEYGICETLNNISKMDLTEKERDRLNDLINFLSLYESMLYGEHYA